MALREVHYRLHAEIRPWPGHEDQLPAFNAQFQRRASQGKCFYQPYFGCREFPAYFKLVENSYEVERPFLANQVQNLGLMLYDVFDLSRPGGPYDNPSISLFRAVLRGGILEVPEYESPEVLKAVKEEE
jgi:CRISPR-associated protein Cas5d